MDLFRNTVQKTVEVNIYNATQITNTKLIRFSIHFVGEFGQFPQHLIYLHLGHCFKEEICELPQYLLYLHLGHCFNKEIIKFPQYLLYLLINGGYNNKIYEFPQYLVYLHLNRYHNSESREYLQYITHLHLGYYYIVQKIEKCSQSLLYLHLGWSPASTGNRYDRCYMLAKHFNKKVVDGPSWLTIYYY